jgi:hypothetical protein
MEAKADIVGLKDSLRALRAAFPEDQKERRRILNRSIGASARKNLLPIAKQMALTGDGSGALSESLGVRAMSRRWNLKHGRARAGDKRMREAGMVIVPVRSNRKALAMYIRHYYTNKGKTPPASIIVSGIRHGHLIEFGSVHNSAKPFLWPATVGVPSYTQQFARDIKKYIAQAVKRAAKKRAKK